MQSISSVASGGEIARVMLSIKAMIAGAVKLPTIVFDEIDTGVSGEIADRMADMMQEMGDCNRQVISITHLPQIAARGRAHYKVYKKDSDTETNSHIRRLTDEERVEEIAHMLSGATLTEAALSNAKALLPRNSVPLLPGNIPLRYRAVNPSCFFPFQTCDRLRLSADSLHNFSRTIRYYLLQDTYPSDFFHAHRQVHKNDSDITLNNRNLSY